MTDKHSPRPGRRSVVARLAAVASGTTLALGLVFSLPHAVHAQDSKVVANVNGKAITEGDLKLADAEVGSELGPMAEANKRALLLEFLIENMTFADAAETDKMASGPAFEARLAYLKRRALRDMYFDKMVREAVKDADAKAFYDEQVKAMKPQEEVSARHILVDKKELADEITKKLKAGGDFAALAKEHSKDPGSKENGGDLGFFGKGQMVPQFEEAAFKLTKGQVSEPVQSQFGWHIIRLDDKRDRQPPAFDAIKDRLMSSLVNQKAQAVSGDLRAKAKIDIVDPDLKKTIDAARKP